MNLTRLRAEPPSSIDEAERTDRLECQGDVIEKEGELCLSPHQSFLTLRRVVMTCIQRDV